MNLSYNSDRSVCKMVAQRKLWHLNLKLYNAHLEEQPSQISTMMNDAWLLRVSWKDMFLIRICSQTGQKRNQKSVSFHVTICAKCWHGIHHPLASAGTISNIVTLGYWINMSQAYNIVDFVLNSCSSKDCIDIKITFDKMNWTESSSFPCALDKHTLLDTASSSFL